MLYRTLKRMIERGNTEGMAEKLDICFAANKLTEAQYVELSGLLTPVQAEIAEHCEEREEQTT